jgi:hypothetical protein
MTKQRFKKQKILSDFLPSTPCTPEMRNQVVEVAEKTGKSLAEIQREAIGLFLNANYSKAIVSDSETIERVAS